jgi:hypothetical protein
MQAAVVRGQTTATWGLSGSSECEDANYGPWALAAWFNHLSINVVCRAKARSGEV